MRFAGSGGRGVGVGGGDASAGLLAERIAAFPCGTSCRQTLAVRGDKMGGKDHCCVTTGRLKARKA